MKTPRKKHSGNVSRIAVATQSEAITIGPKWAWHYRTLLDLKKHFTEEEDARRNDMNEIQKEVGDSIDRGADEYDHQLAIALLDHEHDAEQEIDDALSRIRNGTYGICEVTGQPIPPERLRAVPWTRFKQDVAARFE